VLKKSPSRRVWICLRCLHARTVRLQGERSPEPEKSEKIVDPIEEWLRQHASAEPVKAPPSPADLFRTNWAKKSSGEQPASIPEDYSLADLAGRIGNETDGGRQRRTNHKGNGEVR
jgi:hypothetical protein